MGLNRYSYVDGNLVNFTDASGMFMCNTISPTTICKQFEVALRRADIAGLPDVRANLNPVNLDFSDFKLNTQKVFGISAGVYQSQNVMDFTCSGITESSPANAQILALVAALVHVGARIKEAGISSDSTLFKSQVGSYWRVHLGATGYVFQVPGGTEDLDAGQGKTNQGKDLYLGSDINIASIVHELGHVVDFHYGNLASDPLLGLRLRGEFSNNPGQPVYGGYNDATLTQNGLGLTWRASPQLHEEEIWADMFMTWVLSDHAYGPENYGIGITSKIQWDYSGKPIHAKFKKHYVELAVEYLLLGTGHLTPKQDFVNSVFFQNKYGPNF